MKPISCICLDILIPGFEPGWSRGVQSGQRASPGKIFCLPLRSVADPHCIDGRNMDGYANTVCCFWMEFLNGDEILKRHFKRGFRA